MDRAAQYWLTNCTCFLCSHLYVSGEGPAVSESSIVHRACCQHPYCQSGGGHAHNPLTSTFLLEVPLDNDISTRDDRPHDFATAQLPPPGMLPCQQPSDETHSSPVACYSKLTPAPYEEAQTSEEMIYMQAVRLHVAQNYITGLSPLLHC